MASEALSSLCLYCLRVVIWRGSGLNSALKCSVSHSEFTRSMWHDDPPVSSSLRGMDNHEDIAALLSRLFLSLLAFQHQSGSAKVQIL